MSAFIVSAVFAIRKGRVIAHGKAMIRAYAIGQGAATQAFLGLWVTALTDAALTGPLRDFVMLAAWGLNLLAAEIAIAAFLRSRNSIRTSFNPAAFKRSF
jgi:uncharacterized membrane protein YozB (DUF420 family)